MRKSTRYSLLIVLALVAALAFAIFLRKAAPPEAARLFLRVDWTGGSSEQFDARRYNGEFADFNVVVPQGGDATLTATYDQDGTLSTKQPGDLFGAMHITIPATGLELRVDVPR